MRAVMAMFCGIGGVSVGTKSLARMRRSRDWMLGAPAKGFNRLHEPTEPKRSVCVQAHGAAVRVAPQVALWCNAHSKHFEGEYPIGAA